MYEREKHLGSDSEDIEDVLRLIEKSYDIRFEGNELGHIRTFGQLTDHIISKITLEDRNDCTDQQAFYKLRTAIETIKGINKKAIGPKTPLDYIFPRQTRINEMKKIEKLVGSDLKALRPRHAVVYSLLIVFFLSLVVLVVKWQFGLTGLLLSIAGMWIAEKTGKEFKDKTLRGLVDRMTQLNYTKSRRMPGTMNTKEIHNKIEKCFIENLGLEQESIDRDTVIM